MTLKPRHKARTPARGAALDRSARQPLAAKLKGSISYPSPPMCATHWGHRIPQFPVPKILYCKAQYAEQKRLCKNNSSHRSSATRSSQFRPLSPTLSAFTLPLQPTFDGRHPACVMGVVIADPDPAHKSIIHRSGKTLKAESGVSGKRGQNELLPLASVFTYPRVPARMVSALCFRLPLPRRPPHRPGRIIPSPPRRSLPHSHRRVIPPTAPRPLPSPFPGPVFP